MSAITSSWFLGTFHDYFKSSILLPILKSGKDPSEISSYRLISFLSCLGKLIENMVYSRLYSHFENNNLIPNSKCGFKEKTQPYLTFFYIWKIIFI